MRWGDEKMGIDGVHDFTGFFNPRKDDFVLQ